MALCQNSKNGGKPLIFDAPNYVWTTKYAYGGEITTDASGYIYHTFTNKKDLSTGEDFIDTLVLLKEADVSILLVGGGSGGTGWSIGHGGGMGVGAGGGEVKEISLHLPRGRYRVQVGHGGIAVVDPLAKDLRGGTSSFSSYDASGGQDPSGGYYPYSLRMGGNSGSGKLGGIPFGIYENMAPGGAGDTSVGASIYGTFINPDWRYTQGYGGDGTLSTIINQRFGAGGGGSSNAVPNGITEFIPIGGLSGGGTGAYPEDAYTTVGSTPGTPNTGGGAGGGTSYSGQSGGGPNYQYGSYGGSGIVVVRIKY